MSDLTAALDADVLVPIIACDLLLTAFEAGLYEPIVSTTVLDETERALRDDFPHLAPSAVTSRVDAMRLVLDDHLIDADPSTAPTAINPKDQHVVAAAIAGEASLVVTNDRRLRDEIDRSDLATRAVALDEFGRLLWERSPDDVDAVVESLVLKRRNPPTTRAQLLASLRNHLPSLAHALANDERRA